MQGATAEEERTVLRRLRPRRLWRTLTEALMSAEADAMRGADYGQRSGGRVNRRNGHRSGHPAGTVEPAIPKLRSGSYFPEWLLETPSPCRAGMSVRAGGPSMSMSCSRPR